MPGSRTSMITTSGSSRSTASTTSSPVSTLSDQLEVVGLAEHEAQPLRTVGMVVHREALRGARSCAHSLVSGCNRHGETGI